MLDSLECGIHYRQGGCLGSTRMRNAIEEDKEPAMPRLNSFRPNAIWGALVGKVRARYFPTGRMNNVNLGSYLRRLLWGRSKLW